MFFFVCRRSIRSQESLNLPEAKPEPKKKAKVLVPKYKKVSEAQKKIWEERKAAADAADAKARAPWGKFPNRIKINGKFVYPCPLCKILIQNTLNTYIL